MIAIGDPPCDGGTLIYEIDPRGHFVYCLWGASEKRPFYVGQTSSLLGRLGSHAMNPIVRRRLRRVSIERVATKAEAVALEKELIRKYRPPYNVRDNSAPGQRLDKHTVEQVNVTKKPSWRQLASLAAADDDDDGDIDDEFLLGWCPACRKDHRPDPCEIRL